MPTDKTARSSCRDFLIGGVLNCLDFKVMTAMAGTTNKLDLLQGQLHSKEILSRGFCSFK